LLTAARTFAIVIVRTLRLTLIRGGALQRADYNELAAFLQ
jgi:hypothetical protein